MKKFNVIEGAIRRNFFIYSLLRNIAPTICKFIALEDGFEFLRLINKTNSNYVAIDIGANDGTSIRMINKFQSNVQIESFDPIAKPKFKLKNVNFHSIGLSNKIEILEIYTPIIKGKFLSQYSSVYKEKLIQQITSDMRLSEKQISIQKKSIEFQTLDHFHFKPFFIKIDVEGAELNVLKGARSTISKFLPVLLIEIQNLTMYQEIEDFMAELNYLCIDSNKFLSVGIEMPEISGKFSPDVNNYIWVPKGKSPSWEYRN